MSDKPTEVKHKIFYFVDGEKFETNEPNTTGAIIKSKLPVDKRGYSLFLQGQSGDEPVSDRHSGARVTPGGSVSPTSWDLLG